MSYRILEVKTINEDGRILSHEYFIVNAEGDIISESFGTLEAALAVLEKLEEDTPPPPQGSSGPSFRM